MLALTGGRKPPIYLFLLAAAVCLYSLSTLWRSRDPPFSAFQTQVEANPELSAVQTRVEHLNDTCDAPDSFEELYGRTNLRVSRGYEGSHYMIRRFLHKALRGESVTIGVVGGSVSGGHGVEKDEVWFHRFQLWLEHFLPGDVHVREINGAAPAVGSDYFSYCFNLHIDDSVDLVAVELSVNDEGIPEHVDNMENLIRGLSALPRRPAIVLVEAMAFSNGGMAGGGGRMHLPVAQFFDVPFISQRWPLANHLSRFPELTKEVFSPAWYGPDLRHIGKGLHQDLGNLLSSLIKDVACNMLAEPTFAIMPPDTDGESLNFGHMSDLVPITINSDSSDESAELDRILDEQQRYWPTLTRTTRDSIGALRPGLYNTPVELGLLPRKRALDGWNPDMTDVAPPFKPQCFSTRSKKPEYLLQPAWTEGWEHWVHPDYPEKPYWIAKEPGARIGFQMTTSAGTIKLYSLHSRSFGLGKVECWVDEARDRAVVEDGWWNRDENIGRFATIAEHLSPGEHKVTCELLRETTDPEGRTEFRILSIMSI